MMNPRSRQVNHKLDNTTICSCVLQPLPGRGARPGSLSMRDQVRLSDRLGRASGHLQRRHLWSRRASRAPGGAAHTSGCGIRQAGREAPGRGRPHHHRRPQRSQPLPRPARPRRPRPCTHPPPARRVDPRGPPGRRPPDTAQSLNNLATVLADQGDLQRARPLYERALRIREARLGVDHPDTVRSRERLAAVVAALENRQ